MPRHFTALPFALALLSAAAFWPMYLSKRWIAIDLYTHTHAILGTAWLLILMAQPVLILRGYRRAHRITGRVSLFIAFGFVISSLLLTHFRVSSMTEDMFDKEGIYIYLPLAVGLLFAVACALGIHWRSSTPVHARFMVTTALLLVDPVLARIMYFYLPPLPSENLYQGITFTMIAIAMLYLVKSLPEQVHGRNWYRNYCLGALSILALFFVAPYTKPWLTFVCWFRALPLT